MTLGFVMLVHTALERAEQIARHLTAAGCPVVIHVDAKVRQAAFDRLKAHLADNDRIRFCKRVRADWGTWSLVAATQCGAQTLLQDFPDVRHVYLMSGACLPLRPIAELRDYLDAHPETDFIESVTTDDVDWTVNGLEIERFTLRFPFSWQKQRRLFDSYVALQRTIGLTRRIPDGVLPHLGSQWWCLTRTTLEAILNAPDRATIDGYFSKVWIPDESYFQSLVRRYAQQIESRSLTLSKFDVRGRPHIFYDDHVDLLKRSDCFFARKVWPRADLLYRTFLSHPQGASRQVEPNPARIDRVFARANDRRQTGRPGLYNQGRFPLPGQERGLTSARYNVFSGFDDLFDDFSDWLGRRIGGRVHGHLYHPDRAEFAGGDTVLPGAISNDAKLRDYRPTQFLTNLLWSTRGERQSFFLGPGDQQDIVPFLLRDSNALIAVISGAWAVPLHRSQAPFADVRARAARLQKAEMAMLRAIRSEPVAANVMTWTLADFLANPKEKLQNILDQIAGPGPRRLTDLPQMNDLADLAQFLQRLQNEGMKPQATGDVRAVLASERGTDGQ